MRFLLPVGLLVVTSVANAADQSVDFSRDVLPILSDHCFACHGPDANARKADLRLDTKDGVLRKNDPVVVPGKSAASELVRRVVTDDPAEVMPPGKGRRLTPQQVATLKAWVDQGAAWGKHWSFEKPLRPAVPAVTAPGFAVRNPIDAFVLARLQREGLSPSPEASKEALIRRVTLDLTGLPPTPAEVDAFLADRSTTAYETVVDRLLASPHYGERMAWDWLDAARYADSNGYQGDGERTMWPWRDWAVGAFNSDLPYDRFTVQQLAGDLLPNATREQILATGFLRNHMINGEGGRIAEENRVDYVMDMAETTGTVWLGLTFNCCRCHDHKFDPVKQTEYYGLFAFFNQTPVDGGGGDPRTPPVLAVRTPADEAKWAAVVPKLTAAARDVDALEGVRFPRDAGKPASESAAAAMLPKEVRDALKPAAAGRTRAQLAALEKQFSADAVYAAALKALAGEVSARDEIDRRAPKVMVMADRPTARDTFVLSKGLYNKPGDKVPATVPAVLGALSPNAPRNRLALATWLVSPDHPLTARVTVNRLWQPFFGVGLVKTTEDFGVQGERPGNQPLLDWLACEFVAPTAGPAASPWSVKHLVRLIVTSSTYRQSAKVTPALVERDPDNRLLARGPRFRLPAWAIRDQALAASGLLVRTVGGPPVNGYQPAGVWEEATFGTKRYTQDHGDALYRRSLYTFWRRIVGPTNFFDTAARQTCAVKTSRTNTPLQALTTLNDPTYVEAARALAELVMRAESTDAKRTEAAVRRVLARKPTAVESRVYLAALARLRKQYAADPAAAKALLAVGESKRNAVLDPVEHAAFATLCGVILNLDETLTKE